MGELYRYQCKQCGFSEYTSSDGCLSLMHYRFGHYYKCPQCNQLFARAWTNEDLKRAVNDYSFEEDEFLADLFTKDMPEKHRKSFKMDIEWFQHEVRKGKDSKYYGHIAWTKRVFWDKFFSYLSRREYVELIGVKEIKKMVNEPEFEKQVAYLNLFKKVRCNRCDEIAMMWCPNDGCPKCGNELEMSKSDIILID